MILGSWDWAHAKLSCEAYEICLRFFLSFSLYSSPQPLCVQVLSFSPKKQTKTHFNGFLLRKKPKSKFLVLNNKTQIIPMNSLKIYHSILRWFHIPGTSAFSSPCYQPNTILLQDICTWTSFTHYSILTQRSPPRGFPWPLSKSCHPSHSLPHYSILFYS